MGLGHGFTVEGSGGIKFAESAYVFKGDDVGLASDNENINICKGSVKVSHGHKKRPLIQESGGRIVGAARGAGDGGYFVLRDSQRSGPTLKCTKNRHYFIIF